MKCPRCQHENPPRRTSARMRGATRPKLHELRPRASPQRSSARPARIPSPPWARPRARPTATRQSTSPRRSSPRRRPSKANASRSPCSSLISRVRWSCSPTAIRRRPASILDPVLERMMEAVHRYEGTVNQVMGDGIMALFGAPLAHEDHAVRACYAALRMQERSRRYAEEVRRPGSADPIRVGLNSGEVVVRSIGSDLHMDYTAVGQTTHLAARMEQMAVPGSTLSASHTGPRRGLRPA